MLQHSKPDASSLKVTMKNRLFSRNRILSCGSSRLRSTDRLKTLYNFWVAEPLKFNVATEAQSTKSNRHSKGPVYAQTCIASLYLPLVKYLRAIGFCPLAINQDPETKLVSYEFKWRSWWTFYSVFIIVTFGIISTLFWISLTLTGFRSEFDEVLKLQGIYRELPRNLSFVSEFGTRLVPSTFPFFSITAIFGIISSAPGFLQLLHRWPAFQREYLKAFPHRMNVDPFATLRKYRNTTFIIFPVIGFAATTTVAAIMQDCECWKGCMFPVFYTGAPTILASFTMLINVGGHSAHLLMFRTLTEIFNQIRIGIKLWSEGQGESFSYDDGRLEGHIIGKVTYQGRRALTTNIKSWKKIVTFAKEQVNITGKSVALHHILMILINFIYLCLGVFSSLSSKLGSAEVSRGYMLLLFCTWGFSLLIAKAFICEKIVEQEKLIITQLRKLDVKEHVPSLIQLNSLIDLINDDPAEIRFWNVLTLNKSFLLQLIGQAATYLIVLIQFDNIDRDR